MSKELDKNRIMRLKALDEELSSTKEGVSMAGLIEKLKYSTDVEANRHAIKRDMTVLKDMKYDIQEIHTSILDPNNHQKRRVTLYKYRNPRNTLFRINISQEERDFLSEAFAMLGLKGIELMNFFIKLKLKKSNKSKQIISFTKNPVESKVSKWFQNLYDAIKNEDVIRIGVHDRLPPYNLKHHTVHPWYLREYNRRWYLFGYDVEEGKVMRYTLDRIDTFKKITGITYLAADVRMDEILKDVVGVSVEEGDLLEILFWVSDVSADYVNRKLIHHSQKKISKKEAEKIVGHALDYKGGMYFTIRCKENYELRREMLSFGSALVVLTPQELRDTLRQQLSAMIHMYD